MRIRNLPILLLAAAALACGKKDTTPAASTATPAPPESAAALAPGHGSEIPPGHPSMDGSGAAAPVAGTTITGKVMETMDAGGYTYALLGDVWVAVPQTKLKKGEVVTVIQSMVMPNFESKTLGRKFDKIVFAVMAPSGPGSAPAEAAPAAPADPAVAMQQLAAQHAVAAAGPANVGDVKVPKAEGADGRTIAEVYSQKGALKDKKVAVRGTVVKFLPQIMGKNWIHLRDGSGSHADKTDDLTVTTDGTAKPGDVVVARGTVRADKDYGAGYSYSVIVEDAALGK